VKGSVKAMLDKIQTNQKIYIPKVFTPITLDTLNNFNYLVCTPSSLLFDRVFKSILDKGTDKV
jgi:hypothetical protein